MDLANNLMNPSRMPGAGHLCGPCAAIPAAVWSLGILLSLGGIAGAAPPAKKPTKPAQVAPPERNPGPALAEAAAMRAARKFDAALEVLRNESREIRKIEGEESPKVLLVNDLAAEVLVDQGELEKAEALLGRTIDARKALVTAGQQGHALGLGKNHLALGKIRMAAKATQGAIDSAMESLPLLDKGFGPRSEEVRQGSELLESAVKALDSLLGPKHPVTIEARQRAARQFEALGDFGRGIAQRQQILAGYAAGAGSSGESVAEASEQLARLMAMTGRAGEALAMLQSLPPTPTPPSPSHLRLVGDIQLAANRFRSADATYASITGSEAARGKASLVVMAEQLRRLLVDIRRGRPAPLPESFSTALPGLIRSSAANEATIDALLVVGDVLVAMDDAPAAISPLTKAVELAGRAEISPANRATKGPARAPAKAPPKPAPTAPPKPPATASPTPPTTASPTAPAKAPPKPAPGGAPKAVPVPPLSAAASERLAAAAGRLAAAHLAVGDAAAARQVAEPALAVAAEALGPGHGSTGYLRVVLADALRAAGDTPAATKLAKESLGYGLARPDDRWEESVVAAYDRLAAGDAQDDLRGEYIASRERQFGERHPHVAFASSCFGKARLTAGDWPAAASYFSRSLDLQRAISGNDHPDVAAELALLAHATRAGGNAAEAARIATEAVAAWERRAGANHPGTLAALEVLVSARIQAGIREGVVESLKRLCAAESITDPARRARSLVQLAEVTAKSDKATATTSLHTAMKLPCWETTAVLSPFQRQRLAATAALASRVFNAIGDPVAGKEAVQKAHALVMELSDSIALHERIDTLAASPGKAAVDW